MTYSGGLLVEHPTSTNGIKRYFLIRHLRRVCHHLLHGLVAYWLQQLHYADSHCPFGAFATQEKEALAKLADIDRQARDTRKLDEAERLEAEKRQADLEAQIAASGTRLAELQAQVKVLEDQAADLTNKLDDLASTDSKLKDSTDALKSVESHKAEVVAAIAALVKDRDERTRELLAATEHGRAQSLLTQTLTQRREALEKEVHLIEEQQTELSQALGGLREQVRVAESELKEREAKVVTAEQR